MSFGKVYESYNINCLFKIFQELCTFICNVVGRRVFAEMLFCVEDSVVAQLLCLYFGINVRYLGQHRSVSFFFFLYGSQWPYHVIILKGARAEPKALWC